MSLFVRLEIGYWTHRKTVRLRALIGDAAFWVPPRLWSYAAQNQPDGDFSAYLPVEIAMFAGYTGDAMQMLEALQQALFMDGLKIHGWADHNAYHVTFAERAKKAAAARWGKEKKKQKEKREESTREEKRRGKHCLEHEQAMLGASPTEKNGAKKPIQQSDEEWISELSVNPTYTGIDVRREYGKMCVWCKTKRYQPTRMRFVNWLNRVERPMGTSTKKKEYLL